MENFNVVIGEKMTLGELDREINGHIEKYDVKRDLIVIKEKIGSLDVAGINFVFKFDEFDFENELNTVVTITDIDEL